MSNYVLEIIALVLALYSVSSVRSDLDFIGNPNFGMTYYRGIYYGVTGDEFYTLYISTDLYFWDEAGEVFSETTLPSWVVSPQGGPDIRVFSENDFRIYFTALDTESKVAVGVASAKKILGPYNASDTPLLSLPSQDILEPSIINKDGDLFMVYTDQSDSFSAINLTKDGLGVLSESPKVVLTSEFPWEKNGSLNRPSVIQHENMFYLFYSASDSCDAERVIAVARSNHPLGPYEKLPEPFLTEQFSGYVHPGNIGLTISKHEDEVYDVVVYDGFDSTETICNMTELRMATSEIIWSEDQWPTRFMKSLV